MSEGPGLGAICLVQPCQAAGVVPTVSMPMTDSCEALASALPSKEKRVGWPWPWGGTLGVPFSLRASGIHWCEPASS